MSEEKKEQYLKVMKRLMVYAHIHSKGDLDELARYMVPRIDKIREAYPDWESYGMPNDVFGTMKTGSERVRRTLGIDKYTDDFGKKLAKWLNVRYPTGLFVALLKAALLDEKIIPQDEISAICDWVADDLLEE